MSDAPERKPQDPDKILLVDEQSSRMVYSLQEVAELLAALIVKEMRADLAHAWRDIATAPKDKTDVLLFGPLKDGSGYYHEVCAFYRDRWPVEWMDNCLAPTHWMPLPQPPKGETE